MTGVKHISCLLILLLAYGSLSGQDKYTVKISQEGFSGSSDELMSLREISEEMMDVRKDPQALLYELYERGYLLAAYEKEATDSIASITIYPGMQFKWLELDQGSLPERLMNEVGFRSSAFYHKTVNFRLMTDLFRSVIEYSEDHGYPFATIRLNRITIEDHTLAASIDYDPGPYISFGDIRTGIPENIKPSFLSAILQIRHGMMYDQNKIDRIPAKLAELDYLTLNKPVELIFSDQQCEVVLDISYVPTSFFDGIVGFLPNQNEENKWLITGQLYLRLTNLFHSGKEFEVDWKKPNILSQQLHTGYVHPVLFNLPVDLSLSFDLFKQDSVFINREIGVNIINNQFGNGKIGVTYTFGSSRLLSTEKINSSRDLDKIDYNLNAYGLVYQLNTRDDTFFPTRGLFLNIHSSIGHKSVLRNTSIDQVIYEGVKKTTLQLQMTMAMEKYFTLWPENILMTSLSSGLMTNEQLFLNDLFRLGGLTFQRGFNENHFYASWYAGVVMEYRYLFDNDSQLIAFFDATRLGYEVGDIRFNDFPFGAGAGFSIGTKAGLLNIFYALGKSKDQPFSINYSKIHIGYSNRF